MRRVIWMSTVVGTLACQSTLEPRVILVTPQFVGLGAGGNQSFTASVVSDRAGSGVAWTLSNCPGGPSVCGSLTDITATSATYQAPTASTYVVVYITATLVRDTTKSATVVVQVGHSGGCGRC